MVKSPCILVCTLQDDICIGCKRTKEEITKWMKYTDEEKQKVLDRLKNDKNGNNRREENNTRN